jgi:hypothetical protein
VNGLTANIDDDDRIKIRYGLHLLPADMKHGLCSIGYLMGQVRMSIGLSDMKNSLILGLIFLLLACSSFAAPLQLSGGTGRAILATIDLNNSINSTEETNSTNESELWSWGNLPVGHFINTSGKLAANPIDDGGLVVVSPRSDGL